MSGQSSSGWRASIIPILTVLAILVVLWYAAAVFKNLAWEYDQNDRATAKGNPAVPFSQMVTNTMDQKRPVLPAPHQVATEMWDTTAAIGLKRGAEKMLTSKRSLFYHAWVTLSATLLGFLFGTVLGVLLAVGITHNRAMDMSVMPWVITSQTIPIIAIAPMIIIALNNVGVTGLIPKALISTYLSFFPVVVGMVKGLRSPDAMQLDLMRTYNANGLQSLWKLRLPASLPYLFTSMKIAMAAALVGTIVGELPTGAVEGLGSRLLAGSQFGQPLKVWSALFAAAILSMVMIALIGFVGRFVERRMGMAR